MAQEEIEEKSERACTTKADLNISSKTRFRNVSEGACPFAFNICQFWSRKGETFPSIQYLNELSSSGSAWTPTGNIVTWNRKAASPADWARAKQKKHGRNR